MSRRIVKIEAAPLDLELKEPFVISGGESSRVDLTLVRMELSDGTVGLGEAAPFPAYDGQTRTAALEALARAAPALIGLDPLLSHRIQQSTIEAAPGSSSALCAVEMAALDGFTRQQQCSLHRFVGSANASLVTDLTIVAGDLDHASRSAREASAAGFKTLKIKVGRDGLDHDLQRLEMISRAAPDCGLVLDANGGYEAAEAQQLIEKSLADGIPIHRLEQPVPQEDETGMARLTALGQVAICADESCRSAADAMRIVQHRLANVINIKTQKCGVLEAIRIHQIATAAGLSLMMGGMVESLLSMSFSAHLARGLGGVRWIDLDTPLFIREHPFVGGIEFDGESVTLDEQRSGHGVDLSPGNDAFPALSWKTLAEENVT